MSFLNKLKKHFSGSTDRTDIEASKPDIHVIKTPESVVKAIEAGEEVTDKMVAETTQAILKNLNTGSRDSILLYPADPIHHEKHRLHQNDTNEVASAIALDKLRELVATKLKDQLQSSEVLLAQQITIEKGETHTTYINKGYNSNLTNKETVWHITEPDTDGISIAFKVRDVDNNTEYVSAFYNEDTYNTEVSLPPSVLAPGGNGSSPEILHTTYHGRKSEPGKNKIVTFAPNLSHHEVLSDTKIREGLTIKDRIRIIAEALTSYVNNLQKRGLAHRDIKPGNIMLDEENKAILFDMDLVEKAKESVRSTSKASPVYSIFNYFHFSDLCLTESGHFDRFSWGITILEMYTSSQFVIQLMRMCKWDSKANEGRDPEKQIFETKVLPALAKPGGIQKIVETINENSEEKLSTDGFHELPIEISLLIRNLLSKEEKPSPTLEEVADYLGKLHTETGLEPLVPLPQEQELNHWKMVDEVQIDNSFYYEKVKIPIAEGITMRISFIPKKIYRNRKQLKVGISAGLNNKNSKNNATIGGEHPDDFTPVIIMDNGEPESKNKDPKAKPILQVRYDQEANKLTIHKITDKPVTEVIPEPVDPQPIEAEPELKATTKEEPTEATPETVVSKKTPENPEEWELVEKLSTEEHISKHNLDVPIGNGKTITIIFKTVATYRDKSQLVSIVTKPNKPNTIPTLSTIGGLYRRDFEPVVIMDNGKSELKNQDPDAKKALEIRYDKDNQKITVHRLIATTEREEATPIEIEPAEAKESVTIEEVAQNPEIQPPESVSIKEPTQAVEVQPPESTVSEEVYQAVEFQNPEPTSEESAEPIEAKTTQQVKEKYPSSEILRNEPEIETLKPGETTVISVKPQEDFVHWQDRDLLIEPKNPNQQPLKLMLAWTSRPNQSPEDIKIYKAQNPDSKGPFGPPKKKLTGKNPDTVISHENTPVAKVSYNHQKQEIRVTGI